MCELKSLQVESHSPTACSYYDGQYVVVRARTEMLNDAKMVAYFARRGTQWPDR